MQIHLHQDRQGAIDLLELAEKRIKPNRKFRGWCMLNVARGWTAIGNTEKTITFGNQAAAWQTRVVTVICDAVTAS